MSGGHEKRVRVGRGADRAFYDMYILLSLKEHLNSQDNFQVECFTLFLVGIFGPL